MNRTDRTLSATTLLEHTGWMQTLAIRLVRDADEAENVVQETSLALLEMPPGRVRAPGAWLRRVVHNLALQSHRRRYARSYHESRAARPEALQTDAGAVLEQRSANSS